MHICHIVLNNLGGAPKVADSLISSQVKAGYKISTVVLTILDPRWEISFKAAQTVIVMKIAGSLYYIGGAIHQIWVAIQLSRIIAEQKPDIIVCHSVFITKLFYISQFIPGSLSVPYISYIHSDYISESQVKPKTNPISALIQNISISLTSQIDLRALQQASGLVFVCKTLYERFSNFGLNQKRILISYNPAIDDISNQPLHPTADSWLNNSQLITFVCAARFHRQKDHKTLLKAFAKVSKNHLNIRLILLGDGDLETEMQALANSLAIGDIVLFAGSVPNPRAYFSLSRAVILTSHFEGLGMVLVEAVASGVTFIATDCPVGPREISEVLKCGTIVPPSDVDALAAAIIDHVKTPQERIDRSEQIAQLFSETSCANRLESMSKQILFQ
ncbi:glycosyltransferase [Cylindrospermum stagnale PCC 7417]|uniref:Glycosyltransferase n=1 Tax=Cylindrospermum stagnale PCC 7417 TaxID=56107 RepID=K9X614_9NOST|nr:glycosyltransferase [Cylindrospermum stagnale]AFZ28080.1 glycosyltransferase [Cylindrospermum stagnale PCC 7417]